MKADIAIALAGNPNSGKTTIFNRLTGGRQHVGNYPGVTVECKEGYRRHRGHELLVTDLPGTYDLTPTSIDERIASDHLTRDTPDVVVVTIDSTNLERHLYLVVQLCELGIPLVLALNMSDLAEKRGIELDIGGLSRRLGVPVVATVGNRGLGIDELLDRVVEVATSGRSPRALTIDYGADIETEVVLIEAMMAKHNGHVRASHHRWYALKFLEGDTHVASNGFANEIRECAAAGDARLRQRLGGPPVATIVAARYRFIADLCDEAVVADTGNDDTTSARLDRVLTHRIFGLPIFFGLMYLVFQLTFTLANPVAGVIESAFARTGALLTTVWPGDASSPLLSLLVDGLIGGVGGVLVFLPNIVLLFLAIALLESSGYMARAAFMMDRLMSRIGLHGKSFIPMLLGFGCSVPAIMATRTLDTRRDRLTTMLVVPLMSCSARLTIFALIIPAFFAPQWQGPVLWLMYIIGILLAVAVANILRSTLFKGEKSSFCMELPPYHTPTLQGVVTVMWSRAWLYLRKAGTVILGISVVLWALATFPRKTEFDIDRGIAEGAAGVAAMSAGDVEAARRSEQLSYSIAGRIGHAIEPAIRPMGFDWRIGTAFIGAFAAKEVFVAQMGIVYAVGDGGHDSEKLRGHLRGRYPPLVGFCILLFALIATPCMATVAIVRRESNSWGWALLQFGGLTALAYVLTVVVFQTGRVLGIGI